MFVQRRWCTACCSEIVSIRIFIGWTHVQRTPHFFFSVVQQPILCLALHTVEVSLSQAVRHTHKHNRTPLKDVKPFSFSVSHYGPTQAMASSFLRFLGHTQRRTTLGRTPLDEWSARLRDLYLKKKHTTFPTDKHSCPRWESNPQSLSRRATADVGLRHRAATGPAVLPYSRT